MTRLIAKYKVFFTAVLLMTISLFSMSSQINTEKFYFRTFLFSIVSSVEYSLVFVYNTIKNISVNIGRINSLETRLQSAEQRLLRYRELTFLYDQLQKENESLRNMLKIQSKISYTAHYSKVVFKDPTLLSDYIILDKGIDDGIRLNMPVVYSSHNDNKIVLIGKIVELTSSLSKVKLITSKNFYLGVKLAQSSYTGILKGQGSWNQNLVLNYIPIEANSTLGEEVITSGESEIYPPNLYIGKIQSMGQNVMEEFFQILYIKPEFNYNRMSSVFVLDYTNNNKIFKLTENVYEN
ncbi:MAG: rod shape-determining protein MreC [Brevinemataceae bacterium]